MTITYCLLLSFLFTSIQSYKNNFELITQYEVPQQYNCNFITDHQTEIEKEKLKEMTSGNTKENSIEKIGTPSFIAPDPINEYRNIIRRLLFGDKAVDHQEDSKIMAVNLSTNKGSDTIAQYTDGKALRAELFQNSTSVHLPMPEFMHKGHCYLKETSDYMQTALNAFSIFLEGDLKDVLRLPPMYVLRSARTIAMMKLAREKLVATWTIIKGDRSPELISHKVLEMYRPLFKYLNGREMARLNLSDSRILTYIGTHADLDRHQVGVVASAYIKLNPDWTEPRYLNQMNNLLCGVPMTFMRRLPENTYLQLSHQLFYHIRACDPLQRRFYLTMMTKTQALGKSYSWSARDVARLGLLLAEVDGHDLAAINPEAMSGITSQVMIEIPASSLQHITETQVRYIALRPLNIMNKKLKIYHEQLRMNSKANSLAINTVALYLAEFVLEKIKYF